MAGITINTLSLFSLILVLGIVVNDSLVLIDFINRSRRKGTSRRVPW